MSDGSAKQAPDLLLWLDDNLANEEETADYTRRAQLMQQAFDEAIQRFLRGPAAPSPSAPVPELGTCDHADELHTFTPFSHKCLNWKPVATAPDKPACPAGRPKVGSEAAAIVKRHFVHPPPKTEALRDLRDDIQSALDQARAEATIKEHANHMEFEAELYATLVDPVECSAKNEAEQHEQLLQVARWSRQHIQDLETQLNALQPIRESAERREAIHAEELENAKASQQHTADHVKDLQDRIAMAETIMQRAISGDWHVEDACDALRAALAKEPE